MIGQVHVNTLPADCTILGKILSTNDSGNKLQLQHEVDDDESISYVLPLLQLQTVSSVLMIRSDEQFSFQIATERGWKMAAA